jgi:hypothetical protein
MSLWDRPNGPQTIAASSSSQAGLNTQAALAAILPAQLSVVSSTETVVPNPENTAIALICPLPPNQPSLEQTLFNVVASGYIQTANSTNVTVKLYSGTSLTVGSDTLLGTSGAIAQNTAKAPWALLANLIYDSVSGKLQGSIKFWVNNTLVAEVAISNVITGLSNANNPVASFLLSFTSSAAAGGSASLINVQKFTAG